MLANTQIINNHITSLIVLKGSKNPHYFTSLDRLDNEIDLIRSQYRVKTVDLVQDC